MSTTATQAGPRLIALALRSCPESVPIARRQVRAALRMHGLGEYADDAEIITADSLNLANCFFGPFWRCFLALD